MLPVPYVLPVSSVLAVPHVPYVLRVSSVLNVSPVSVMMISVDNIWSYLIMFDNKFW